MYKELTLEEKVNKALENSERALAYCEIQKVWAAHAYCYRAQAQRYELENFWAKEHDDIMYAHGNAAFVGRETVFEYYAGGNEKMNEGKLKYMSELFPGKVENVPENFGIGDLVLRFQTTPYIEIAADCKTAKGVFYTPGFNSENSRAGEPIPMILVGKECVDFVRESDGWKIWHYRDSGDLMIPLDNEFMSRPIDMDNRTVSGAFPPYNRILEPMAEQGAFTPFRVAKFSPELPEPYDSWSEDISWAKPAK